MRSQNLSVGKLFGILFILFIGLLAASLLQAWTGPTGSAPGSNVSAPINVSTTDQVKNAGLSVNALSVFGRQYLQSGLNIGVLTDNQITALDVNGSIKIGNGGETCGSVTAGAIRYNSSTTNLEYCDGTSWNVITSAKVTAGSQTYSTPGTFTFVTPLYNTLTVSVWGGGGGGGDPSNGTGAGGTSSSFNGNVIANGGGGGTAAGWGVGQGSAGAGGTASGGDTNTTGSPGTLGGYIPCCTSYYASAGNGGASPNGGAGGTGASNGVAASPGAAPGGGGGGSGYTSSGLGNGGGGGGYASKTYTTGQLTQGLGVTVVVGSGGAGGGNGADGRVSVTWQ